MTRPPAVQVDLDDAITRAARAASRAGTLPPTWFALAVEVCGRLYIVVLGSPPAYPVAAVYRVRPDGRLRRIIRWPRPLPALARSALGTTRFRPVPHPGDREGWLMTSARLERARW
jgi:hypothetical protein